VIFLAKQYQSGGDNTETISKDIDFKWNVQQHISSINKLSCEITKEGGVDNYSTAVKNLAMMMKSRHDEKYKEKYPKLENDRKRELSILTSPLNKKVNMGLEQDRLKLDFALDHYGLLIGLLDRLNLLFETETFDEIDDYE